MKNKTTQNIAGFLLTCIAIGFGWVVGHTIRKAQVRNEFYENKATDKMFENVINSTKPFDESMFAE